MSMLMSGSGRPARIHYLAGTFRLLSDGDHVVCAISGARIPIHELRYWSVDRQEAYVDAAASLEAERRGGYPFRFTLIPGWPFRRRKKAPNDPR